MPEISVIMPVYNVEKFLPRCLDSLLNSTFRDFEVICINDGSTDKSLDILNNYKIKDSRIRIITQNNQGLSIARNIGLRNANAEYIYFLDSDDAIHPQCLEICYSLAKKHDAELISFLYEDYIWEERNSELKFPRANILINEENLKFIDRPLYYGFTNKRNRINYNVWTKFYKKQILAGVEFIPKIRYEDYPHTFIVLARNPKTIIVNEILYLYTTNPNSISHQKISVEQIREFKAGIFYVYSEYVKNKRVAELEYLRQELIPDLLRQQLKKCRASNIQIKKKMYKALEEEITELKEKKMIKYSDKRIIKCYAYIYCNRIRTFLYRKLQE